MTEGLRGKRLLLLGGSLWKDAIKAFADKYGVTLLATGNDMSAGIFEIAQEKYSVNSTNASEMLALIKDKNVDGVYLGGSEPVIAAACHYLAGTDKPCYCAPKQWDSLQNKSNFKELCVEYDLPVVPRYEISGESFDEDANKCEFPLVTKPTDGCGSSGFRVCYDVEDLKEGLQAAKAASPTGTAIVEKFVKNDSIIVYYSFSEGKSYFTGMCDKYPAKYKDGGYVMGMFLFESPRIKEFRDKYEEKLSKFFSDLGIVEGSVWIEVFYDGGNYYFNEPGFRYGGSISIYPVDFYSGVNQVAADIYYALTGKSKLYGFDSLIPTTTVRKKCYCVYPIHLNPGRITKVVGIEELKALKETVVIPVAKALNTEIRPTGTTAQTFALVHFTFDTEEECKAMIERIHQTVVVLDENGVNMVNRMYDPNNLNFDEYVKE